MMQDMGFKYLKDFSQSGLKLFTHLEGFWPYAANSLFSPKFSQVPGYLREVLVFCVTKVPLKICKNGFCSDTFV